MDISQDAPAQLDGVLVLNKPLGVSSAACVGVIKRRLGQRKIGHAGTLDPLAGGVLLILLGQATKISGLLMRGGEKVYSGVIRFGLSTDTWDAEGRAVEGGDPDLAMHITRRGLEDALLEMRGELRQEVPPFSAAKHQGRPLYALAREGSPTPVKIKTVQISRAELEWFRPPSARFRVACSSGTYIRSLAHSLGIRFGCGATLMELTREYSHPFGLDAAVSLEDLLARPALLAEKTRPLREALPGVPSLTLQADLCRCVRHGQAPPAWAMPEQGDMALLLDERGAALALAARHHEGGTGRWFIERGLWNN
ncbi:MAG: tRNA pseudouridine(55) synthase TruB [Deltaproteobacteria bacterium]|jgi:tRNA pseudouridine55 synthase|nr:tRNA pseudouridine(55) synthase TruB [Deltaproteobacteria bacterium]